MPPPDGAYRLHTAHLRQAKIHQSNVRSMLLIKFNCLFARACLSNRHHRGLPIDNRSDPNPHQRMFVDNKHSNLSRLGHPYTPVVENFTPAEYKAILSRPTSTCRLPARYVCLNNFSVAIKSRNNSGQSATGFGLLLRIPKPWPVPAYICSSVGT